MECSEALGTSSTTCSAKELHLLLRLWLLGQADQSYSKENTIKQNAVTIPGRSCSTGQREKPLSLKKRWAQALDLQFQFEEYPRTSSLASTTQTSGLLQMTHLHQNKTKDAANIRTIFKVILFWHRPSCKCCHVLDSCCMCNCSCNQT